MKYIRLFRGSIAIVDDDDYARVSILRWSEKPCPRNILMYAIHGIRAGETILMHRLILRLPKNNPRVDHIDGNGLNNQKSNLRLCTAGQNKSNSIKRKPSTSKYKGVRLCKKTGEWFAVVRFRGKLYYSKWYKYEWVAASAYNEMALRLFGAFANINVLY